MKPCKSCPFRSDAPRGLWDPAHYLAIAYLGSTSVSAWSMGCHQYGPQGPKETRGKDGPPCGGWIRAASDSPGVRISVLMGGQPSECFDGTPVLSPEEMARANGLDVDRLPPLEWTPEYGEQSGQSPTDWASEVHDLRAAILDNPELAHEYVVPGSPLDEGPTYSQIEEALGTEAADHFVLEHLK